MSHAVCVTRSLGRDKTGAKIKPGKHWSALARIKHLVMQLVLLIATTCPKMHPMGGARWPKLFSQIRCA
jgi:hypothetical protein